MSSRAYSSSEHTNDPTIHPRPIPEPLAGDLPLDVAHHLPYDHKQATGKHRPVRATSVDEPIKATSGIEGEENPLMYLLNPEPEDSRPDQQDQNR